MNLPFKLLSKSPNYVKRFGFLHGIRLLFQIEGHRGLQHHSKRINAYKVPGFQRPIYLRACVGDHATFWQCIVKNQYEFSMFPQAMRLKERYEDQVKSASTPPLIIDCGGNIGLSAIWFAQKFKKSTIFVIEPDEENLKVLNKNIESFSDRVVVLKGGIWSEPSYAKIANPEAGPASFQLELEKEGEHANSIRCFTIGEVCDLANNSFPLIVKLDIEGSQKELFSKNITWVNQVDLITLELDDWLLPWEGTSRNFFKCLSPLKFDYLLGGESIFCFRDTYS